MYIYKITNLINKKVYIGKSVNVEKRFKHHKSALRNNKHVNKHLQASWNKYREESFAFEVLCENKNISNEELNKIEQQYIKNYKAKKRRFGYNKTDGGEGTVGVEKSKSSIEKQRKSMLSLFKQYTLKECRADALRFKTKSEWRDNSRKPYYTALKKGWMSKCCKHMVKGYKPKGYWTLEVCKQEALKYNTKREWIIKCESSYSISLRNKWLEQCCSHMKELRKPKGYWTLEKCRQEALKYKTRNEWSNYHMSSYTAALKNDWLDICCALMPKKQKPRGYWTLEACKQEALKYKTKLEWQRGCGSSYNKALREKWTITCCAHMLNGYKIRKVSAQKGV